MCDLKMASTQLPCPPPISTQHDMAAPDRMVKSTKNLSYKALN